MIRGWLPFTACIAAMAVVSASLFAQMYQIQGGNVLDASNRVGSGGLNPAVRPYDFGAGNRLMSGNVTGGRSFQGYSPIRDTSSLGLGNPAWSSSGGLGTGRFNPFLPSDRLSNFQRDSYSIGDALQRQGGTIGRSSTTYATPYYSSSGTVANTGAILGGSNRPGTSQLLNPFSVPGMTGTQFADPLASARGLSGDGTSLAMPTRLVRANSGMPVTGQVNNRLLENPLFAGAFREVAVTDLARLAQHDPDLARRLNLPPTPQPLARQGDLIESVDLRTRSFEAEDTRLDTRRYLDRSPTEQDPSPLDRVLQRAAQDGDISPYLLRPTENATPPGGLTQPFEGTGQPLVGPLAEAGNLFSRMREVVDMQMVMAAQPGLAVAPSASLPSKRTIEPQLDELPVLRSFVGTEQSILNRYLNTAEKALRAGEYYRSAALYKMAMAAEPANPLPYLGRSMSLLAAGDYVTSVTDLFTAIQLYDALGLFDLDLRAFIADLTVLDRRRADLEARLEVHDDYRLRFLLGYAEYCSGFDEVGLANLDRAVRSAPLLVGHGETMGQAETESEPIEDQLVRREAEEVGRTALTAQSYRAGKQDLFRRIMAERGVTKGEAKAIALPMIHEARGYTEGWHAADAGTVGLPQAIDVHPLRRFVDILHVRSAAEADPPTSIPPP